VTVDDASMLTLWNDKGKKIAQDCVSDGLLMTAAIEPKFGNQVVVGGIDTKLHLYEINKK